MIRFFFLRVIFPLLLLWFIRGLIKAVFSSFHSSVTQAPKQAPTAHAGGELKKDPVCGTYVSVDVSVTKKVNGELLHFCSANCRDKYRVA
jgi:YHS domain-containing protein